MINKPNKATLKFNGEYTLKIKPKIRLKRDQDGKKGKAIFTFNSIDQENKNLYESFKYMIMEDQNGQIIAKELTLKSIKEEYSIEVVHRWSNQDEFERFMNFATNLSNTKKMNTIK